MKRLVWGTLMLFVLLSSNAFATSSRAIIDLSPNDGFGENFNYLRSGGGVIIHVHGGVPYEFFNVDGYAPGSTLGGFADVFFGFSYAQIHGITYELSFSDVGTLFLSSFTLPTNGKKAFAIPVGASFSAIATIVDTGQTLDVSGGARGKMTFRLVDGLYYAQPARFASAPEPGSLALMGTGLVILAFARKRLHI
jgi:hypothetical protein